MNTPEKETPDGEMFLKQLDAALSGENPTGEHASLAKFGAELKSALNDREEHAESSAPEDLRRQLHLHEKSKKPKSSVVKLDRKLARYRLGILDIAALLAVAILGALIWNALRTPTPAVKGDPEPVPLKTENTFAQDDAKEKPKEKKPDPIAENENDLLNKLQKTVSFEFIDTPLDEGLAFFRRVSNTNIILDPQIAAARMPLLTLKVKDMTFDSALQWMARLSGARVSVSDNAVFISKPGSEILRIEAYDTKHLKLKAESLAAILQRMPFDPPFSNDSKASVTGKDGMLTLTTTQHVHNQVQHILRNIQNGEKTGMLSFESHPAWKAQLLKALEKKVTFEFVDTPLVETLAFLQQLANVPIVIDPKIVAEGPPAITLRVQDMEIRQSIEWLARLADLSFEVRDEAVYIFEGREPVKCVAYKLEHFAKDAKLSIAEMADQIANRIDPRTLNVEDGTSIGEMEGWLVVCHRASVHRVIQDWLSGKVKEAGQNP